MAKYDIIIIGGGITGTAIARELSRYTLKIALLEKEPELAFGVSKSNSGIIHPGTQNPPGSLKGKLCVRGNHLIRQQAKALGLDFIKTGELIVINHESDLPKLEKLKKDGELLGVPGLKIVNRQWLKKHEPNLHTDICAALYAPTAGSISPYRLVYNLAENAAANGVTFFTEHAVTGILSSTHGFIIHTTQGIFEADFIVNAAGLYADDIAKMLGITDFKITPRKGEEYLLDKKIANVVKHTIFPLPTPQSKGTLIIKTSDGNPMLGPTAMDIEDKTDKTTTAAGLQKVLQDTQQLVPSIRSEHIIAYFAGLRPVAGSDFIIRHENAVPGCITVAGIQSPGLTAAPAIAEMVSGLLREHGCTLKKKSRFKPTRKPTTHLFALPFKKIKNIIQKNPDYGDIVCRCEMVSAGEIREAIRQGARTMDGIKFRTRAQAGRCHGGFCTSRIMKIMAQELQLPLTALTKRGIGSELIVKDRGRHD